MLQVLAEMFPEAPIFTSVWNPDPKVRSVFRDRDIRTTPLQRVPGAGRHYRKLLPFMPGAFERLDLSGFDLVISSSHAFSKMVRPGLGSTHVCYCHSPPRYLWDLYGTYSPGWRGIVGAPLARVLRRRDLRGAARVDRFVANSWTVAERIRRHYGREADVIHPPVELERFTAAAEGVKSEEWFLAGGRMVRYKRMHVLVEAASLGGFPLKVFGDGPERPALEATAGPGVEFLGPVSDQDLARLMARCRAFLFAAEEDFGILPVEAQAAGRPVVAWGKGGATETVVHGETGLLLSEGTPEEFATAALEAATLKWDPDGIQANARRFGTERFRRGMARLVAGVTRGDPAGPDG